MSILLIRALIVYIIVIFSVRLMGKRQLGELQPSELVITILVSNIATLSLEDTEIPLLRGILPILALVCFEVVMSWCSLKSVRLRRMISGSPKIIIRNGEIDQEMLHALRFSVDDLMSTLRTVKRKLNPRLEIFGVALTMFDGRTNFSTQVAQEVRRHFPGKVFTTVIPRNIRLAEAPSHGIPVTYYDRSSRGSLAYNAMAQEIKEKL